MRAFLYRCSTINSDEGRGSEAAPLLQSLLQPERQSRDITRTLTLTLTPTPTLAEDPNAQFGRRGSDCEECAGTALTHSLTHARTHTRARAHSHTHTYSLTHSRIRTHTRTHTHKNDPRRGN